MSGADRLTASTSDEAAELRNQYAARATDPHRAPGVDLAPSILRSAQNQGPPRRHPGRRGDLVRRTNPAAQGAGRLDRGRRRARPTRSAGATLRLIIIGSPSGPNSSGRPPCGRWPQSWVSETWSTSGRTRRAPSCFAGTAWQTSSVFRPHRVLRTCRPRGAGRATVVATDVGGLRHAVIDGARGCLSPA